MEVEIKPAKDVITKRKSDKQAERDKQRQGKFNADCELAVLKLKSESEGLTKTRLRAMCRFSGDRIDRVLEKLLEEDRAEECKVKVSNHKTRKTGYRLLKGTNGNSLFDPHPDHSDRPPGRRVPMGWGPVGQTTPL